MIGPEVYALYSEPDPETTPGGLFRGTRTGFAEVTAIWRWLPRVGGGLMAEVFWCRPRSATLNDCLGQQARDRNRLSRIRYLNYSLLTTRSGVMAAR